MDSIAVDVVGVDVDVRASIEDPSITPITRQRRSKRRPRPEFIRDVRRLIEASWIAKTGQRWRWTPLDRAYLWRLAMDRPAWEIMALWDCYLCRPWQECRIQHFCSPLILDALGDDARRPALLKMYRDRLYCKRGIKSNKGSL